MEKVITMVHGAMVISPTLGSLLALWIKFFYSQEF